MHMHMHMPGRLECLQEGMLLTPVAYWPACPTHSLAGSLACLPAHAPHAAGWQLSYKLKFDIEDASQRFFGYKRLQLHASIQDTTLMRERLAYQLFREAGVATVRQSCA